MPSSFHLQLQKFPKEKLDSLRSHFRDAPKALKLLQFLTTQRSEKLNMCHAVQHVYGAKAGDRNYTVYENRFYKLRKKIEDHLHEQDEPRMTTLTAEEKALMEAKSLIANGKFADAEKMLVTSEKNCRNKNIFEILPETIDLLIQARQSLNKLEGSKELHQEFAEAITLYADMMEAKNLTRQIYEVNFKQGIKAAEPLFRRMAKLDRQHKKFPRFKLIYNFVAGYYKVGAGGTEYLDKTNVTNRHIGVAKKIMQRYPEMPVVHYTANGQVTQRYRLMELQAMCYYNALRFAEAADEISQLYASVMQPQSPMNRMKNEILFTNILHMLVAASRYKEALKVAQEYLKFLIENKRHEQSGNAYAEIANIHVSMFPQPSGYNPLLLLKKADEHIAALKKTNKNYFSRPMMAMKVKLLLTLERYNEAEKLISDSKRQLHDDQNFLPSLLKLIAIKRNQDAGMSDKQLRALNILSKSRKLSANTPGSYLHWKWLEKMIDLS
ncbi:MAG: hypothetical protein SH857_05290 [Chitinophagales bacterium]|nr:hypothetical protein [Chitinophagales bacterium]